MKDKFNWLIKDSDKNLWNFYLNDKQELLYSVKQHNDIWKSEEKIDDNIDEFVVNIDCYKKIHIIYIKNKKLKYCIIEKEKKIISILNDFRNSTYEMKELKLILMDKFVYIFCLLDIKGPKEKFVVMNYIWDRKKVLKFPVCEIQKDMNIKEWYEVEIINKKDIFLFFINRQEDKNVFNVCKFTNNNWDKPKKIYDLDTNIITSYSVTDSRDYFNIIILYNLKLEYKMVDVQLSYDFNILKEKIYKSNEKIINPIILTEDDKPWLFWIQNDKLIISPLDEINILSKEISNINGLILYNYILSNKGKLKGKKIFGINPPDKVFLPSDIYENEGLNKENHIKEILSIQNELKEVKRLKLELQKEKENRENEMKTLKQKVEKEVNLLRQEIERQHIYNTEMENNKSFFERIFKR